MNQFKKSFRTIGGVFILLNIVVFFFPMTQSVRENYPTKAWSQLQYVTQVMGEGEPYATTYSSDRMLWMLCLIILPLLLSALAGVWGIVGDDRQIVSPILSLIVLCLYIGLFVSVPNFYPNQSYCREVAGTLNLICSGLGAFCSIIGLFGASKSKNIDMTIIPEIEDMKKEQIEAKYTVIENVQQHSQSVKPPVQQPEVKAYVPKEPRGVVVGLYGMYAGAEISLRDGETIRLGRNKDNDLIFDDEQKKVSRNHCTIKWDGKNKEYLIYDNSTVGTFANGSDNCLPKHLEVIVKVGTVIDLGDEQNRFRLE